MTTKKTDGGDAIANTDASSDASAATASKPHFATRDFKDAGTERQFFANGKALTDVEPGELANYVAAGLASTDRPATAE